MSVNGTFVEDKMRGFNGECAHFSFNNCSIYTHDGASAKFSTNSHETAYSVLATRGGGGGQEMDPNHTTPEKGGILLDIKFQGRQNSHATVSEDAIVNGIFSTMHGHNK